MKHWTKGIRRLMPTLCQLRAQGRQPSRGARAGLREAALTRLADAGCLGVARRQILGLPDPPAGESLPSPKL